MDDPKSREPSEQLALFPGPPPAGASPRSTVWRDRLERERSGAAEVASKLPRNLRFGTSSWSFPGWAGIVYPRRASTSELAREGLVEYARHPLLTTVGIDRSFYAPIPADDLRRYAEQLPAGFPCCAKAPEAVTGVVAAAPGAAGRQKEPNPDFLSVARFEDEMLGPFREAFADHAGPFLLQFPPAPAGRRLEPLAFAERLDRFLADLPGGFSYAVELRDPRLLSDEYRLVLASRGVAHVYNCATAMPMPEEQARTVPVNEMPFVVIRLLLRPGTSYDDRREEFLPFDRIVDANPEMRRQVVSVVRAAKARDVFVLVNNKAEGCAPATIRALAEELAEEAGPG